MHILFLFVGIIIGVFLSHLIRRNKKVHGKIYVDLNSGLCRVCISSSELSDPKVMEACFIVDHNAVIEDDSRDEQCL